MKILLLTHKFHPDIGGIESVSEMLAEEFVAQGEVVRVLTWSVIKQEQQKAFGYEVIRRPGIRMIIKSLLWADIVFENNPCLRLSWPNFFIRKPQVVALHTWISTANTTKGFTQKLKFFWLQNADKVIACSDALRKDTFPAAVTIGNPYNHVLFRQTGVTPSKDYVFLGRLVSDKGVALAITAFYSLLQQVSNPADLTFTIIGEGEEKTKLEQQVQALGITAQVIFSGSLKGEPLVQLLNEHKYMIVPSLWQEPFGIVALEGIACGCLPIVSDGGGLPDAVGAAGVTFETGNAGSLTTCMIALRNTPAMESKIRLAAMLHLQKHEADSVAKQYLQVLRSVIQRKTGK